MYDFQQQQCDTPTTFTPTNTTATSVDIEENHEDANNIRNFLSQIGEDITTLKTSILDKKPKMTLSKLNEKLDKIISILEKWDT